MRKMSMTARDEIVGALERGPADRLGRRRGEADRNTAREAEARAVPAGPVGQGHGTVARLVRSRTVDHQPPVDRAAAGGASGRVPGRSPAYRSAV